MSFTPCIRRLVASERAATIVEFGLILAPFCMLVLGTLDLGYRAYLEAQLQGTLQQAARMATIGDTTEAQIDTYVKNQLEGLTKSQYVTITKRSYSSFSLVGKPETIVQDKAPVGEYNSGDCFVDANGNGVYDVSGGKSGLGSADEIVQYNVSITFPRLVPIGGLFGWPNYQTVTANTSVQNQPFAAKPQPKTICK